MEIGIKMLYHYMLRASFHSCNLFCSDEHVYLTRALDIEIPFPLDHFSA
jgi:hypothetical protein